MPSTPAPLRLASVLALVVLVSACASTAPQTSVSPTPTPDTTATAAPSDPVPSPPSAGDAGSGQDETAGDQSTAGDLAGTPIEFFFQDGDTLGVVGVAADDVLNVRAGPGVDSDVVATLAPLADDVIATGAARQLPRSFWVEVDAGAAVGWANARFLAYLGATDDATSEVVDDLGGQRTAETMLALGRAVAQTRASTDPRSDIVVVARPTVGDLGEITVDVIGLGDDAAVGLRLHVFGQPIDNGFDLRSVEETELCGRGVTADGLCV